MYTSCLSIKLLKIFDMEFFRAVFISLLYTMFSSTIKEIKALSALNADSSTLDHALMRNHQLKTEYSMLKNEVKSLSRKAETRLDELMKFEEQLSMHRGKADSFTTYNFLNR